MCSRLEWILSAALLAWPAVAGAEVLGVVNVGAPGINCVFNPGCTITVSDSVGSIPLPGIAGTARLQSRTFTGAAGAPAAGFTGYEYRVDLTDAVGIVNIPCVQALRVTFGPVAAFQYNGAGPTDQVYVITAGGLGTIGLASATKAGDEITFNFAAPVCAGGSPGHGDTSFFFGLASARTPIAVTAVATPSGGGALSVAARAPSRDKCATGSAFSTGSDACVSSICTADPFCCTTAWDAICVSEVRTVCDDLVCSEAKGSCVHSVCASGASLANACDATKADCVSEICAVDSYCCNVGWDGICVDEVELVCNKNCD
ncbi:MAG TPA: hypothetical protein VK607_14505 [Kofleriaceae bacterium]|nr:hypothetical protein [Kofleriaceae bacterium]HMG56318.1 hypothetical protein [Kofleriaceae bacterium]